MFRIINDGAGSAFFDFTGGNVTASTTGSSFQIKTGENFQPPPAAYPGYYTGLSCVSSSGGTAVVRILALR